ncbi:MAG: hypothetical protein AM325_005345 [Candidatus Thorarchaeota archaeon SMTZ1-45]|nr:MAG: hypothetical protein AM325_07110 [Candidatus Thorarchaeota archaeon SMTZ1-45]
MDIGDTNRMIKHISDTFSDILAERGLLESEIFPTNEYISVSCYHTYYNLYDVMNHVWSKITPEDLAKQSKTLLSEIHALSITYLWLYYSLGRMGIVFDKCNNDPRHEDEEKQKEWQWMLNQWYRLGINYFNTGEPTVASSERKNLAFSEDTLSWIKDNLESVNTEQVKKIRRIMGQVELYAFMDECEARAKLIDHGPYPFSNDEILVLTEFTRLHDGRGHLWLPWSDTEAKLPSAKLGVAMTIKGASAKFNDIGTMNIEPGDYSNLVTNIAAYTERGAKVAPLGLDELPAYAEAAEAALSELYMKFADWDKKKLMLAGAVAYWRGFARYTDRVNITDKIDWNISQSVIDEYVPFFMENDADPAFIRFGRFDDEMEEDPTLYLLPE